MSEIEVFPQKKVDTKTIILRARLDQNMAKIKCERLKKDFFPRFGFLKPKDGDISLIALNKFYEPSVVIGGKYSINYCKRHVFAFKVEDQMQEVFVGGEKFKPEPLAAGKNAQVVKLVGEEHAHYENETYIILDKMMREVSPENMPCAPSENELENPAGVDFDLRKVNTSPEEEIELLRSRIVKRPLDVAEIIRETFEINERSIIYSPFYELAFQNIKNGREVTAIVNGITGEVVLSRFERKISEKGFRDSNEPCAENITNMKMQLFQNAPEPSQTVNDSHLSIGTVRDSSENTVTETELNASPVLESVSRLEAENATALAVNFLKRLGYKHGLCPLKVSQEGEIYVVEVAVQRSSAKVQVDTKTKEIKEYEIQEAEQSFFTLNRKVLLLLSSIVAVIVILKLLNVF